jgi:hypothetical protein
MKVERIKILPFLLIITGIFLRLLPHHPNIVPIGAIALFSGIYLPKKWNWIIPLVALLISDYFIGYYGILMFFIYGSYALIAIFGQILKKFNIFAPVIASLIFFTVSNFGVWATANWYPHTASGLLSCFVMALPFFKKTIVGDVVYSIALFGGYEIIKYAIKKTGYSINSLAFRLV